MKMIYEMCRSIWISSTNAFIGVCKGQYVCTRFCNCIKFIGVSRGGNHLASCRSRRTEENDLLEGRVRWFSWTTKSYGYKIYRQTTFTYRYKHCLQLYKKLMLKIIIGNWKRLTLVRVCRSNCRFNTRLGFGTDYRLQGTS